MTCELAMMCLKSSAARGGSFLARIEEFLPNKSLVFGDARRPLLALFAKTDTAIARRIVSASQFIAFLFGPVGGAKVSNPIVMSDKIRVVNLIFWPFAMKMNPCESMRAMKNPTRKLNIDVSVAACSGNLAGPSAIPAAASIFPPFPSEKAGFGIVVENGADKFSAQRWLRRLGHFGIRLTQHIGCILFCPVAQLIEMEN